MPRNAARHAALRLGHATTKLQPFTESGLTLGGNRRLMRTVRRREGRPAYALLTASGGGFMGVVGSTFVIGIVIGAVGVFLFRGRRDP